MAATAKTQLHLKLSSFYGAAVPRPYVLLDKETGEPVQDRVDPPQVNDALIGAYVILQGVLMLQQGRRCWCMAWTAAGSGAPGSSSRCLPSPLSKLCLAALPKLTPCGALLPAEWAGKVPFEQGGTLVKPHWDGAEMPRQPRSDFQARACLTSLTPALCGEESASDRRCACGALRSDRHHAVPAPADFLPGTRRRRLGRQPGHLDLRPPRHAVRGLCVLAGAADARAARRLPGAGCGREGGGRGADC
jgi:hypothetical protein